MKNIAVIGSGTMGNGIAHVFAQNWYTVTLIDVSAEALNKAGYPVERKNIEISEESIKALGTYTAKVRLFKEISATVNFEVIAE